MVPATAPDEAFRLESIHDGLGDAVAPAQGLLPAPVVGYGFVEVNRNAEGV
jgi:hypothetical protein